MRQTGERGGDPLDEAQSDDDRIDVDDGARDRGDAEHPQGHQEHPAAAEQITCTPAQQQQIGQTVNQFGRDPWLPQSATQQKLRRGASVTRRGLGLATLLGLSLLGAVIIGTISLLLLIFGVFQGSAVAGWLLAFTLLLGLFGLIWTARRAFTLLNPPPAPEVPLADAQAATDGEQNLLTLLHTHERALPAQAQGAFRATVIATRGAASDMSTLACG